MSQDQFMTHALDRVSGGGLSRRSFPISFLLVHQNPAGPLRATLGSAASLSAPGDAIGHPTDPAPTAVADGLNVSGVPVPEVAVSGVPVPLPVDAVDAAPVAISGPEGGLSVSARARLRRATAEATRTAYRGDLRRFLVWAAGRGLLPAEVTPSATGRVDDAVLAAGFAAVLDRVGPGGAMAVLAADYVDSLATAGKAPSTIDRALAALAVAHRAAGAGPLAAGAARGVLRGYRREAADAGRRTRTAKPVTVAVLRALVDTCDPSTLAGLRDRALLVAGFALGARRSELAALDLADLDLTPAGLQVTIRRSKTDLDAVGRVSALPYGTHFDTCPVRTVQAWTAALTEHGITGGPLFRRIDRHGTLGRAPHGRGPADGRLTGQAVAHLIHRAATRAGLDAADLYTGHSLRRGFATETYRAGADPLRIARHAGWTDGSPVLARYIETVDRWKANPLTGVGL